MEDYMSEKPALEGGSVIKSLKKGDEVIVKAGYGHPRSTEDKNQIIADVDGYSALTADGTLLDCRDGAGVVQTGIHHDEFQLSQKAQQLLQNKQ